MFCEFPVWAYCLLAVFALCWWFALPVWLVLLGFISVCLFTLPVLFVGCFGSVVFGALLLRFVCFNLLVFCFWVVLFDLCLCLSISFGFVLLFLFSILLLDCVVLCFLCLL